MSDYIRHSHACRVCGSPTPCAGKIAQAVRGSQKLICTHYHVFLNDGFEIRDEFVCDRCQPQAGRQELG